MSVLVQMRVRAPDVERFKAAYEQLQPTMGEHGGRSMGVYQAEHDPNEVAILEEWDSHDSMNEATEEYGESFNAKAGTEGLDWEIRVWHKIG